MKLQKRRMYECPVCEYSTYTETALERHIAGEAAKERRISQGIEADHLRYPYRPSQYY